MRLVDAKQPDGGTEVGLGPDGAVVNLHTYGESSLERYGPDRLLVTFGGLGFILEVRNGAIVILPRPDPIE